MPQPAEPGGPPGPNTAAGPVHGMLVQARDVHGDLHVHTAPEPPPTADVCLDAPQPATRLRGRAGLLAELEEAMAAGERQPAVLAGPGGIGKSAVAAELAARAAARGRDVFWIRPGSVGPGLLEAAVEAGGPRSEAAELRASPRRAARWAWRCLDAAERPWLLVIDNADRPEELDPDNRPGAGLGWLRPSSRGLAVVTTRIADPAVWAPAPLLRVGELATADAAAVLCDHALTPDSADAAALAERLGGIPLPLTLAGRAVATRRAMLADFSALEDQITESVLRIDALAAPASTPEDGGPERGSLGGTWEVSVALLADIPQAAPLLRLLSVLGADGAEVPLRRLPLHLLRGGTCDTGPGTLDEAVLAEAANALATHGLADITVLRGEPALRVHPLIAETTRDGLGADGAAAVGDDVERLLDHRRDQDLAMERTAGRALLRLRSRALGDDHPDTLRTAANRARIRSQEGDAAGAATELARLSDRARRALGPDHPVTLHTQHCQGDALISSGRLNEARRLYRHVLARRSDVLGPDHADTFDTRHQAAVVAFRQGDLDTAETEFTEILTALRDDQDDATTLYARLNGGFVAMRKHRWDDADRRFGEVVDRAGAPEGPEHLAATLARVYLAVSRMGRGEEREAETAFAAALSRLEDALGAEHPAIGEVAELMDRERPRGPSA
ncbi:tetratricopeptide repeat protein [Streptomonospora sediminis]